MSFEIEEYIKNRDSLERLKEDAEIFKQTVDAEKERITKEAEEKIEAINKQKNADISSLQDKREPIEAKFRKDIEALEETLEVVNYKIKVLQQQSKIEELTNAVKIDKERIKDAIWLHDLADEKYLHLTLYIAENDRPKNKYSLYVKGKCPLQLIMHPKHSYAGSLNEYVSQEISFAPTIEELKAYAAKHQIFAGFLSEYREVKQLYEMITSKYKMDDFAAITQPRIVPEAEAPTVFFVKDYDDQREVKIYRDTYYTSRVDRTPYNFAAQDNSEAIIVNGKRYSKICRVELMRIFETGNTTFGDWWSTSMDSTRPYPVTNENLFNKENWERTLRDTEAYLRKKGEERFKTVSWNPPQVTWIHPELLPKELPLALP